MKLKDAMILASVKYPYGHQAGSPPYFDEVYRLKKNCTKTSELVKNDITDSQQQG